MAMVKASTEEREREILVNPSSSSSSSSATLSTHAWAGFFGGIFGTVVSYPFDTLRVVSQTSSLSTVGNVKSSSVGLWQSYKNMRMRNLSLYSGIGAAMTSQGLLYGFLFGTKIGFENMLIKGGWSSDNDLSMLGRSFVAGIGSGLASAPLTSPLELWKIRLQTQSLGVSRGSRAPISLPKWTADLPKSDLFRGLPATALRCAVGNGAFFSYLTVSELARRRSTGGNENSAHDSALLDAINGGISGVVYWVVCMPFDVIKTRQQARTSEIYGQGCSGVRVSNSAALEGVSTRSLLEEAASIVRAEGYGGLWRGFSLAVYRTIPLQASIYCVYKLCV